MSLVHVNLLCNRVGLLFDMLLFCRSLFLYSNLFYHHTQFQKVTVTLLPSLSTLGQSYRSLVGLLQFTPDWKSQFDLNNKLVILWFIAVNQLRPDAVLFSLSTKTVIILKVTCACEENMEEWDNKKYEKYHPLSLAMVSNSWSVH